MNMCLCQQPSSFFLFSFAFHLLPSSLNLSRLFSRVSHISVFLLVFIFLYSSPCLCPLCLCLPVSISLRLCLSVSASLSPSLYLCLCMSVSVSLCLWRCLSLSDCLVVYRRLFVSAFRHVHLIPDDDVASCLSFVHLATIIASSPSICSDYVQCPLDNHSAVNTQNIKHISTTSI